MTAPSLVGASAPECLNYSPQPPSSWLCHRPLCIQYTVADDYDLCLCFPLGSEGQSDWVIRRELPKYSAKTTTFEFSKSLSGGVSLSCPPNLS